jgi:hypothetical protein
VGDVTVATVDTEIVLGVLVLVVFQFLLVDLLCECYAAQGNFSLLLLRCGPLWGGSTLVLLLLLPAATSAIVSILLPNELKSKNNCLSCF